jgi:hypothetical protein
MTPGDLYHTGIVVPDLEASMARMTEATGHRWTTIQSAELPIRFGDNEKVLRLRYVYSLDAPCVELVQEIPGTPWTAGEHHLGYLCDDLLIESERLVELGFALEACAVVDGTQALFAYHLAPSGTRIEIVDRELIPDFAEYLRARTPR